MSCSIYHKKCYVMNVNSVLSSNVQNFINNNNNNKTIFKSRVVEVYSSSELTSADRHFNQYEGTICWLYTLLEAAKKSKYFSLSKIEIPTISKANLFKMLSEGLKASETWKSYEKKLGNIFGKM